MDWSPDYELVTSPEESLHVKLSTTASSSAPYASKMTSQPQQGLPHPWAGDDPESGFPVTLLTELCMVAALSAIREKPNWWEKYKDPTISARWKQELIQASAERSQGYQLGETHLEYVFKELEWYAEKRQKQIDDGVEAPIEVGIDGTRRSDGLIPPELKGRLMTCVEKLKNVPDHLKDWHPWSKNQVLDLVHPSLFPFIAGRSKVTDEPAIPSLECMGQGKVMDKPPSGRDDVEPRFFSKKFQWLPTDFKVNADGKVKIQSYINNLHPEEHKDMYPVLEEIFEKFLPMFEDVLGEVREIEDKKHRLDADPYDWYERPNEDRDNDGFWDHWYQNRVPKPVVIPDFEPPKEVEKYHLRPTPELSEYSVASGSSSSTPPTKTLQVIVKLANIELTPENPKYTGGSWHVEGMANENIVASGIYYYHTENITESRLNFRIQVKEPGYEQSDDRGVSIMYGLGDQEALNQNLGGIVTKQDRCIAFPNIYQHQVQPFELEDPTKAGSRSILVFFLVDPETPILSTTHVPPQQKDWDTPRGVMLAALEKLPPELVMKIHQLVDWPIGLEEAKEHRLELMKERKYFVKTMNEEMFERPFYLCEH
ncbi:hypothetical protein B0O80DRAFT_533492 [Mortierella sp. GBAus27b]|nr:hypothetical protein BGX31_011369 [Mortierella sp. GBA43]KAI8346692.1 hypothetical protein B0O80DRAFT_533492 [Mortierella sp. GBAus27b]